MMGGGMPMPDLDGDGMPDMPDFDGDGDPDDGPMHRRRAVSETRDIFLLTNRKPWHIMQSAAMIFQFRICGKPAGLGL